MEAEKLSKNSTEDFPDDEDDDDVDDNSTKCGVFSYRPSYLQVSFVS